MTPADATGIEPILPAPKLDPNCQCICHRQPGFLHAVACCSVPPSPQERTMTDAPKRIWADPPETFDGMDVWRSEPGGKGVEYILASEHAALIREAEARGMERAANIAVADAKQLTEEALQWRADNMPFAAQFAEEQAKAGPRIAASIRAAKAAP